MINACHINQESKWEYLPWQTINGRVVLIQKKIFEASKQYNLELLHNAQNFLLNSNEAKLLAIEKIVHNTRKYYKSYSLENYLLEDIDKFYLFKYLFNNKSLLKTKLKFLAEKVKEYLIFLCLESEWEARLEPLANEYIKTKEINCISYNINIENVNWNQILYKNQCLPYIYNHILYWLKNRFIIDNKYYSFKYLVNLLLQIYNLGIEWSKIKLIKWQYFCSVWCDLTINNQRKIFYLIIVKIFRTNRIPLFLSLTNAVINTCLLYTSPSPRDKRQSRMPSSA